MSNATPVIVSEEQDRQHDLVRMISMYNAPAMQAKKGLVKVDINWAVDGEPIMFDIKTPKDLIDSVSDGRLHAQLKSMKDAGCRLAGFFITGAWSESCGRDEDTYENQILRLELEGAKVTRCENPFHAGRRVASLWRWTQNNMNQIASFHAPESIMPSNDHTKTPPLIFFDETFRSQVGAIMHIPGVGPTTANQLRENHPFMSIWGITEDGLLRAKEEVWLPTKGVGKKTLDAFDRYVHA